MAAVFMNKSILRNNQNSCMHCLWKKSINNNTVHRVPSPKTKSIVYQLHQSKWCSRYLHSAPRRRKDLAFPTPSVTPSTSPKVGFVGWYLGMVKTRPIVTKSFTASFIYTAADLSSQMLVGESSDPYDFVRTLRMAGYGMIILGPSLHYWFNFMSKTFPNRDIPSTIKKIVTGQTVYGPIMTATFFSVNAALQGESVSEIVGRLKRDVIPTMVNGFMYWPLCDFLTFKYVPVYLQPVVSNSFSYIWTIYITYMASLAKVGGGSS